MSNKKNAANNKGTSPAPRRPNRAKWSAALRTRVWDPLVQAVRERGTPRRVLLAIGLFVLALTLAVADTTPDGVEWEVGDVATRDIAAPRDVINRQQTDELRDQAAREAVREAEQDPANWEINPAEVLRADEKVMAVYDTVRTVFGALTPPASEAADDAENTDGAGVATGDTAADAGATAGDTAVADTTPAAVETTPAAVETTPGAAETVAASVDVEAVVDELAPALAELDVDLPDNVLDELARTPVAALAGLESLTRDVVADIMGRRISEADLAQQQATVPLHSLLADVDAAERTVVVAIVQQVLRPNLLPSPEKIERARQEAIRGVSEVRIREGQIIVRRGDPVELEHLIILRDLGLVDGGRDYSLFAGMGILVLLVFGATGIYLYQQRRDLIESEAQIGLLGLIVLIVMGLAKVGSVIGWSGAGLLVPVGLAGLLVTLLLASRVAVVVVTMLAVLVAAMYGLDGRILIVALAGGLAAVFSVSRVSQRSDLTRAGFIIGGTNFLTMIALGLLRSDMFLIQFSFLGLLNGIVSAIGTIGLLPYLETLFGITSSIRLLELSNPNHPLLRKLLMEAPGTYHHSMLVGNLAEAAAEVIDADQLLVRVGSQYHDIGKTKRPYFFIENQFGGENPHDKISPTLSTLIIVSHVKDGVELAEEYKLPPAIIDFIHEHHGTALVEYFYRRASENAQDEVVDEQDFRYPGPKPQTKETAVVMLADAVEAAVRSLGRPTPGRIEGLVRRLIKERLEAGQLDESNLTLRDLDKIADAFVRVLTGLFHKRVEYPDIGEQEQKKEQATEAEAGRVR